MELLNSVDFCKTQIGAGVLQMSNSFTDSRAIPQKTECALCDNFVGKPRQYDVIDPG